MTKKFSMPMAMKTRKFYCHKCGEELTVQPRTRIITRSDPDYNKHNKIGRTHMSGNVELTEYDFFCRSCKRTIPFSEQLVIEKIQKKLGKRILSQEEISENTEKSKGGIRKKRQNHKSDQCRNLPYPYRCDLLSVKHGVFSF